MADAKRETMATEADAKDHWRLYCGLESDLRDAGAHGRDR